MKNEALKKHHFWILAGIATFLGLLTALFMWTGAGSEISAKMGEIETKKKEASSTNAKGTKGIAELEQQKVTLTEQKEKLWKANYQKQKDLFAWPANAQLQGLAKKFPKFGEQLPNSFDLDEIKKKEVYEAAYDDAAKKIRPTQFANQDWRTVLRHVSDWTVKRPSSLQVWLALEDLWVQRTLLEPVTAVNEGAARFELLPGPNGAEPPALTRSFRSRVWDLELSIPTSGPHANRVIEARLSNRTDRLQLYGLGNVLKFKVWLDDPATTQPILYRLEGDFVKAGETVEVKLTYPPDSADPARAQAKKEGRLTEVRLDARRLHSIPANTEVRKITKVEQVLDEQTVPIRRIAAMELGKKDARHAVVPNPLKPPKWAPTPEAASTTDSINPGTGGATGSMDGAAGATGGRLPGMPGFDAGGTGGGGASRGKRGTPTQVCDANINRYLETTDQVRRMPVAVLLIVDQLFMQEALVAYANSSLRFQVTQYHWKRFRGSLGSLQSSGGGNDDDVSGGGYGGAATAPGMPGGRGSPGAPGGDGGDDSGGPGFPSGRGFPSMGGFGGLGSGGSSGSSLSEGQRTSGLIELTIYGVVTLYERYDDKPADGTATTTTTPAAPTTTTPTPTETQPMQPMGNPPMTPSASTPAPMTPMTPAPAAPMTPTPAPATPGTTPSAPQPPKM